MEGVTKTPPDPTADASVESSWRFQRSARVDRSTRAKRKIHSVKTAPTTINTATRGRRLMARAIAPPPAPRRLGGVRMSL